MGKNESSEDPYDLVTTPRSGDGNNISDDQKPGVSFKYAQLYRFASFGDKLQLAFGVLMATLSGVLLPLMAVVFGNVLNGFSVSPIDMDAVDNAALDYFLIAIGLFFADYFAFVSFHYSAERQMKALRSAALRHMLYLDVSWYDSNDALQLSSRLTGDTVRIKSGMGQKLGESFKFLAQFITGFVIGFVKGWDITLVMTVVMPITSCSLNWLFKLMHSNAERSQKLYAEAGAVAEETLGSMRTIVSLNGEKRAVKKYEEKILVAQDKNITLFKMVAVVYGVFFGSMWFMYAAGLWYGGHKIVAGHSSPGQVFSAFSV